MHKFRCLEKSTLTRFNRVLCVDVYQSPEGCDVHFRELQFEKSGYKGIRELIEVPKQAARSLRSLHIDLMILRRGFRLDVSNLSSCDKLVELTWSMYDPCKDFSDFDTYVSGIDQLPAGVKALDIFVAGVLISSSRTGRAYGMHSKSNKFQSAVRQRNIVSCILCTLQAG